MISKKNLDLKLESINNKRYCTLNINEEEEVLEYEINMIKNNQSLPFLDIDIIQVNSTKKILYQLDSKVSLLEIIEDKKYDVEKLISIVESVYNCAISVKEFMLDNRKMILDHEHIFIDSNLVPYMIYMPFKEENLYDIKENFNNFLNDIVKEIKNNKYDLTNNDKKVLSRITSNRIGLDEIAKLLADYKKKKDEERLLDKPSKSKEDIDYKDIQEEKIIKDNPVKEKIKEAPKEKYNSIIEEDYSKFSDFDKEEDLDDYLESQVEYEEYKDIHMYDKKIDSRQKDKKIIIIQLIVLMLLGSLGLIISYEDKKVFTIIAIGMGIVIVIFTALIISSNKGKE